MKYLQSPPLHAGRRYEHIRHGTRNNNQLDPILLPNSAKTEQSHNTPVLKREIAEEKERARKAKEAERLAKLEQKRIEKEAKDRERAEQHAREQARRGIEKERARLAKRYPLPDEVRVWWRRCCCCCCCRLARLLLAVNLCNLLRRPCRAVGA